MKRTIVGFRLDEEDHWVAELDCGHGWHVRHQPPFVERPWVASEDGRRSRLGSELDCVRCDRMEWPEGLTVYNRTPEFDETTIPAGLRSEHSTKRGVWGRIRVLSGVLHYHVNAPVGRTFRLDPESSGVVVPELTHRVEPEGPVRFHVEFARKQEPA